MKQGRTGSLCREYTYIYIYIDGLARGNGVSLSEVVVLGTAVIFRFWKRLESPRAGRISITSGTRVFGTCRLPRRGEASSLVVYA